MYVSILLDIYIVVLTSEVSISFYKILSNVTSSIKESKDKESLTKLTKLHIAFLKSI